MSDSDPEAERVAGGAPTGGELFEPHSHRRGHSPDGFIAQGTDWRFIKEVRKELGI